MKAHDRSVLFSSDSDEWATPQFIFDQLNAEYNFTLDPAASDANHKCVKFYDKQSDGLSKSWKNERVFLNPPYSETKKWIDKCIKEKDEAECIVLLIASRTDTEAFHSLLNNSTKLTLIKGRLKFNNSKNSAPFPSCIVVLEKNKQGLPQISLMSNKPKK